jgi:uncharacterized membrane protein YhaH (DUF805 family)
MRGTLGRRQFWILYFAIVLAIFMGIQTLGMIAAVAPGAPVAVFDFMVLAVMLAGMLAIISAMARRLRDAGYHWVLIPLAWVSLIGTVIAIIAQQITKDLNVANGTYEAWLSARWPVAEGMGLVALAFVFALFFALTRKSRPCEAA